ncbi:MAG: tetratricopeptide repeat protein, partial [Woeseiaceae bacterium]|nr:tetratricopeptide repeat protein [Woeseiaceae bacterium]
MSIAVLPFTVLGSAEPENELLATGIQDGLLTSLANIGALRVISRTSTERYRGTEKSIPQIGHELRVGAILEGSLQRAGDDLRINVQLIDSSTDEHLWAAVYDRDLSAAGVFSMQTEIVRTIAEQLRARLTQQESDTLNAVPTRDMGAYTAYLRGRQQADIESVESMNAAIEHFSDAIERDPFFALAHVGLADAYLTLSANFFEGLTTDESIALAEPPLARALELDPASCEAHTTLGFLRIQQGNLDAAESAFENAITRCPGYARAYRLYGRTQWVRGERDAGLSLAQQALDLDPYSAAVNFDLARYHDISGRFDEAMAHYRRVVEIEPNHAFAYIYIAAIHYLVYGRVDESLIWYHEAASNDALSASAQSVPAIAYLELGDADNARVWIDRGMQLAPRTFYALFSSLLFSVYEHDVESTRDLARTLLEEYPQSSDALHHLRNIDLAAGRYEVALSRYARAYPALTDGSDPVVDIGNLFTAIDLALVYRKLGDDVRAEQLLQAGLRAIPEIPRLGVNGYWIADVRIHAIRGDVPRAVDALAAAIDEGWRLLTWYHFHLDPTLEPIRHDPRFQQLRDRVEQDLAEQARRVKELQQSGDLPALADASP